LGPPPGYITRNPGQLSGIEFNYGIFAGQELSEES
jgi:hypothetical protein